MFLFNPLSAVDHDTERHGNLTFIVLDPEEGPLCNTMSSNNQK